MKINGQVYYIFRVLNEEKKLKIFYILALMIDAMVFPLAQVFTSFSEKWLVNAVEFHDSLYMNGVYILSTVIFILIFFLMSCSIEAYNFFASLKFVYDSFILLV